MTHVGKIGEFVPVITEEMDENNFAWMEYKHKECKVIAYDDEITKDGLVVIFSHDSQMLSISNEEFLEYPNTND